MELSNAIKDVAIHACTLTDEKREPFTVLLKLARLVEAMRGKLIVGENQSVQKCIDDCAAAYIANLPTEDELYEICNRMYNFPRGAAQAIHALLVSKIRGEK
jgi:hypothetical protein